MKDLLARTLCVMAWCGGIAAPAGAQQLQHAAAPPAAAADSAAPAKFVIGVGDVLSITFWRDERLSRDVLVRPDGKIALPLINDISAAGYTPEQLATALSAAATKYITEPDVTVMVKEIHSRRVFVVGEVVTPGAATLTGAMTVLQVLGVAGGLHEYADKKHIIILRSERGQQKRFTFNYEEVLQGKNMKQNILLQPDDTIVVR